MTTFFSKFIILMIASLFFLTSCSLGKNNKTNQVSTEPNTQNSHTINGSWTLTNFHKNDISIDRSNPSFIPTLDVNEDEMKLGGRDGCNRIYASLSKLNKEEVIINAIGGTKIGCKMKNPYDNEYRNLLRTARKYKINFPFLILFDEQDIKLLEFEKIQE